MARMRVPKAPPGTTYPMPCGLQLTIDKIKGHSKNCLGCLRERWKEVDRQAAKKAEKEGENGRGV